MVSSPTERKVALLRAGITQSQIARQLRTSLQYVNDVLYGRRRSPRIEAAIAEAIGRPVEDVFPPAPVRAGSAA